MVGFDRDPRSALPLLSPSRSFTTGAIDGNGIKTRIDVSISRAPIKLERCVSRHCDRHVTVFSVHGDVVSWLLVKLDINIAMPVGQPHRSFRIPDAQSYTRVSTSKDPVT